MIRFLKNILFFAMLFGAVFWLVNWLLFIDKPKQNDYLSALIDKHQRLDNMDSPKLIFAGGSNLAFGLDRKSIEDTFLVPVVNMGLQGGLGLNFILEELKDKIKTGDVVVLSIEYFLDIDGNYALQKEAARQFSRADRYFKMSLQKELQIYLDRCRDNFDSSKREKSKEKKAEDVYSRSIFNNYGDIVLPEGIESSPTLLCGYEFEYEYWVGINLLNEFIYEAQSKKVEVFFMYPNYCASGYYINEMVLKNFANDIENDLNVEILNSPEDLVMDDSLFFDTRYHLNIEGRVIRTTKMIDILQKNASVLKAFEGIKKHTTKK